MIVVVVICLFPIVQVCSVFCEVVLVLFLRWVVQVDLVFCLVVCFVSRYALFECVLS